MKSSKFDFNTTDIEKHDCQVVDQSAINGLPGRKRSVTPEIMPVITRLISQGCGYRQVARILRDEYDVSINWSSIRNFVKGRGCYAKTVSVYEFEKA